MPKDMSADTRIEATAGKPVELPSGHFIANAQMSREGMDLHLTSPDGHTIVVEGYFAQNPVPDLVTTDGAKLSPAMVSAFLPPEHAGQYAASGQTANDASPAGKITSVVGEAQITRADGTHVTATVGTPVYQGDVIETSKSGAVNILFTDNTTFAVSESARMSIDQFVYHAADHTGSSFFSMLQGVFVYTSGLIGKSDPGSVSIETPVGSIGIRGTVIAGHIMPAGQHSEITILDGAITLTNGAGTQEMNTSYSTVSLSSYQDQPESVSMDTQTFHEAYGSLSGVAGDTMTHFTGPTAPTQPASTTAPEGGTTTTAPGEGAAPAPAAAPAPEAAPAPTTGSTTPPPAPAIQETAALTPPPPPPSTSTFSDGGSTFSSDSGSTFNAPPATEPAPAPATAAPPPLPPAGETVAPPPIAGDTNAPPPIPPLTVMLGMDTGIANDGLTKDGHLIISGLQAGNMVQFSLDGSVWSAPMLPTALPSTWANGSHSIQVRQIDVNGTTSAPSAPLNFVYDIAAPSAPGVALAIDTGLLNNDGITKDGHLLFTGLETPAAVRYSTDNSTWSGPMAPNALPPGLVQGINNLYVQQIDAAGNTSASTLVSFTLDLTAAQPTLTLATDTGASNTDGITNDGHLTVGGTEAGAAILYSADNGQNWLPGPLPTTWAEGFHSVQIKQIDAAGNISLPSAPVNFIYHATALAVPTIILANDTGIDHTDHLTSVATLIIGHESGSVLEYSPNGSTGWTTTAPTPAEGANTVYVRQTDLAGNTSNASMLTFTLDTTAPGTPSVLLSSDTGTLSNDGITHDGHLGISGLETGNKIQLRLDGGAWSAPMDASSVPNAWAQGAHTIEIRQIDDAGNISNSSAPLTFTYDTAPPTPATLALQADTGASNSDGITNNDNLSVTGAEAGAILEYSTDGGTTWSTSYTSAEGPNTVLFRQTDTAGNTSMSTPLNFILDTTAPTPPSITNTSGTTVTAGQPTSLNFTVAFNEGLQVSTLQSSDFALTGSGAGHANIFSVTPVPGSPGVFNVRVDVTGAAVAGESIVLQMQNGAVVNDIAGNTLTLASPINATTVNVSAAPDTAPPVLLSSGIADNTAGPVALGQTITYTVTFSEDISNSSKPTTTDFANAIAPGAGGAIINVSAVTEISPGVFQVTVTPSTVGDLQLKLVAGAGAHISDTAATPNYLSTAAVIDSTVLTVNPTFNFAPEYTRGTAGDITDDGLDEFARTGTLVGTVNAPGTTDHYTIAVNGAGSPQHFNSTTYVAENIPDLSAVFSINSSGQVFVSDPLALSHYLNDTGLTLTITAYDSSNHVLGVSSPVIRILDDNGALADVAPQFSNGATMSGFNAADYMVNTSNVATTIMGGGGQDVIIGLGTGDTTIIVGDPTFRRIDGGAGNDTLILGNSSTNNMTLDFSTVFHGKIQNIENLSLGSSNQFNMGHNTGNHILNLGIKDVFEMAGPSHTLHITADPNALGSSVNVITATGSDFHLQSGVWNSSSTLTYTGTYNSQNVTLVIDELIQTNPGGVVVTDSQHLTPPPMFTLGFNLGPDYNAFPALGGTGLMEFASGNLVVGSFTPNNNSAGTITYHVTVNNPVYEVLQNTSINTGSYSTTAAPTGPDSIFMVNGSGQLVVNDLMVLSHAANPTGFNLTVTATDSAGHITSTDMHLDMRNYMPGVNPLTYWGTSGFMGTSGADFLVGGPNTVNINGNGGADILIGRTGNNNFNVADGNFMLVEGASGTDKLTLGTASSANFSLDFTTLPQWKVRNIETLDLGTSSGGMGNHVKLNIQDVFDMTDPTTHILNIWETAGGANSSVDVVAATGSTAGIFHLTGGTLSPTAQDLTYTGTYDNGMGAQSVTLIIHSGTSSTGGTSSIHVNQVLS
jgi:hypothetical protein